MHIQNNDVSLQLMVFSCLALYLTNLEIIPIDIMEARNFITAREMITDGNWFHTSLNGFPRYEKPPLPTWITAVFGSVFGLKLWALRLPAALMALISFLYLLKIAYAIHLRTEIAKISIYVAATSFYILFSGKNGQWDIYTHGFAIIGLFYLFKSLKRQEKNLKNAILAGLFFGCSLLSKGPVSIYALVLPFLITYIVVYRKATPRANWKYLGITTIISLVLGSSWFVGVYISNPEKVLTAMLRESENWTSYNIRPFYYYWSFFIQSGIWGFSALLAILIPIAKKFKWQESDHKFSYLWTLFSLLLLSFIPEKKSRYLLPLLFPLAITIAVSIYNMLVYRENKNIWNRINMFVYKFTPLLLSILIFLGSFYLLFTQKWNSSGTKLMLLILISCFIIRWLLKSKRLIEHCLYAYMTLSIGIMWFGLPYVYERFSNPKYKPTSEIASYENRLGITTFAMSNPTPEFVWDYGKKIKVWEKNAKPMDTRMGMLVNNADLEKFLSVFKGKEIELLARFDMNQSAEGSKNHRERLYIDYYLVK